MFIASISQMFALREERHVAPLERDGERFGAINIVLHWSTDPANKEPDPSGM